jgi:formylmethanofuran dehydrogenase subunit E
MDDRALWERAISFHGHICGGLTIGYKVALYAQKLLNINFSEDEEIVCVTENDACGVDAIQVMLGCSVGKGNLLFRLRGKQAYSFFNRADGRSVRLVLKDIPIWRENADCTKEEAQKYLFDAPPENLFQVREPPFPLPEKARIFNSLICEGCGEKTAENQIRLQEGKKLCLDCSDRYSRFM